MIKWIIKLTQRHGFIASFLLAFILMAWDIGNLDAIRQGTEGFYLQISKEMSQESSFLTPLYHGQPHWSKPPLHFWMPFPLYTLGIFETTTAARLTILIFSLLSLAYISHWVERFLAINKTTVALFFVGTIAFAKYSRIFMMEMPLSLFSTMSALALYAVLTEKRRLDWIAAIFFGAAAALIKGPVAWVMIGGALIIFLAWRAKFKHTVPYRTVFSWILATGLLGSLWFIACYIKYGQEFIDYFFLRENLGKFTSKSYPVRVVLQGLLIFSLPWSFYLFELFRPSSFKRRFNINESHYWPRVFVFCNFIVFFCLWLIPNQRSHHYAMPSLFLFLILLIDTLKCHHRLDKGFAFQFGRLAGAALFFSILPVLFLSFAFPSLFESSHHIFIMGMAIALAVFAFIAFSRSLSLRTRALSSLLCLGFTWSFVTPLFILPTVPDKVLKIIGERDIAVVYRKPYFIEEAIEREPQAVITQDAIQGRLNEVKDLLFIPERVVVERNLAERVQVIERWRVWRKSRRVKDILEAVSSQDLSQLQEWLLLVEIKAR